MGSIILENITKKFSDKTLFNNLNIEFENGKVYLLKGESGIGKTTLLNIIVDYTKPDSGRVINEQNLKISYLFQDELLFSNLTVKENLYIKYCAVDELDGDAWEVEVEKALERIGLSDLIDRKVAMLSGGERQRVQIASIMLDNPDVILVDEPTSSLDQANKNKIMTEILEIFRGKTLIIISHDLEVLPVPYIKLALQSGGIAIE